MTDDETNRDRIRQLVSLLPGIHLRLLQRIAGLSFNSTRYHVQVLAKSGQIDRAEEGGYSRLYPHGISNSERNLFSLIRRSTDRRILSSMATVETISPKELCALTQLAKSTISEHLTKLTEAGIVKRSPLTMLGTYELVDPKRIRALISAQNQTLLRKATDRFIDLWDF